MARPPKDGVLYFSLDVDFFSDDKVRLLKAEFGAKGITILIALLCEIYRDHGYYKVWDNDTCLLMADAVGCGVGPENITQVVQGCLRRSLFNKEVFQMFGVLTSAGIQRRFLRGVSTREQIQIFEEYWLLDLDNRKDVPASILNKLVFQSINSEKTPQNLKKTPVSLQNNSQRKGKERKGKERKEKDVKDADAIRNSSVFDFYEQNFGMMSRHIRDCMMAWLDEGMEPDLIIRAMEIAVEHNVRKWNYVDAILRETSQKGIRTLAEFEKEKRERNAKRSTNAKTPAAGVAGEAAKQGGYGTYL